MIAMKKLLVFTFAFVNFLIPLFSEVNLNETKVCKENYEKLAKCFKPEDFSAMISNKIVPSEDILANSNDFELVAQMGQNAGSFRFLYSVFKQQKEMNLQTDFDLNAEILTAQKNFYLTLEEIQSLLSEKYKNQKEYVEYVFSDSVNSAELKLFEEAKANVASGLILTETFENVPAYSLNEIISDFKDNEIAARQKWVGKQVKMSASIYSIYQLDFNTVFNIDVSEKNVVPVMRLNSGNQLYANCFFNNVSPEKLSKYKKNRQVTVVGTVCQDIARRPSFKNCKLVENK